MSNQLFQFYIHNRDHEIAQFSVTYHYRCARVCFIIFHPFTKVYCRLVVTLQWLFMLHGIVKHIPLWMCNHPLWINIDWRVRKQTVISSVTRVQRLDKHSGLLTPSTMKHWKDAFSSKWKLTTNVLFSHHGDIKHEEIMRHEITDQLINQNLWSLYYKITVFT